MALGSTYIPGVCNIGPTEIAMRRRVGHVALGVTIILWLFFALTGAAAVVRLWLTVPATIAAVGYLQASMHFCANFGWRGVFNFSPTLSRTDSVAQAEYRRKDRLKALQILILALFSGLAVGLVAYWL